MKLKKYPERTEVMTRFGKSLVALATVNAGVCAVFIFGAEIGTSAFTSLVVGGIMIWVMSTLVILSMVTIAHLTIPNGLPRPEEEVPKGRVFNVIKCFEAILHLSAPGVVEGRFYRFKILPSEVQTGKSIVYLDDLESEYLAKWKEDGVIPILSAQGRAKMETKKNEPTKTCNRFNEAMS